MHVTPVRAAGWPQFWPAAALLLAAAVMEAFDLDRALARALFYDTATQHWLGRGAGAWWAHDLIHGGGRLLVRAVAATALAVWLLSFRLAALAAWRRDALYVFGGFVLVTGIIGLLKVVTNVDCPWDLAGFGGDRPYLALLAQRPDYLPPARCFPGAHSSSGFALLGVYFTLRGRGQRTARIALGIALAVGIAFAVGQEARGAHFLSHDLASAGLAWGILRALPGKSPPR